MAQTKPQYEELKEFYEVAKKIIENNSEIFPGIDKDGFVSLIKAVVITNKTRKEGADYFKIKGVSNPLRMFCNCSYVVEMFNEDWEFMDEKTREWLVLMVLRRIPTGDDDDGKVIPVDFKDDGLLVRTVGPDWITRDDLPSLTDKYEKQKIKWMSLQETMGKS